MTLGPASLGSFGSLRKYQLKVAGHCADTCSIRTLVLFCSPFDIYTHTHTRFLFAARQLPHLDCDPFSTLFPTSKLPLDHLASLSMHAIFYLTLYSCRLNVAYLCNFIVTMCPIRRKKPTDRIPNLSHSRHGSIPNGDQPRKIQIRSPLISFVLLTSRIATNTVKFGYGECDDDKHSFDA